MKNVKLACKDFGTFDLVVVGGGCTGVCAAIRAARLGLKVAIVEKSNCFGGVATNGLVLVWHTLFDTDGKEQIIAGLTDEIEQLLLKNDYAQKENTKSCGIRFDPNAMKWVLDKLVVENNIKVFFHTYFSSVTVKNKKVKNIIVANKDGIGIISADFFIDATGDGDLCREIKLKSYTSVAIQPPTPCCFVNGEVKSDLAKLISKHGAEFGLENDWGWSSKIPGLDGITFRADFHILNKMCNCADDLTAAEIEGRQKIYALVSLLKKYDNPKIGVAALCSQLGVRETVHFETLFKAIEDDLLLGKKYDDAIMRGTYRVDVHHNNGNGITFKYLNGDTETIYGNSGKIVKGNWREEKGITKPIARYYEVPFNLLVQTEISNLIPVGRMLNADEGAFGALRVMVNLNQLGEAAGVAAYLCVNQKKSISDIDSKYVAKTLYK